VSLISSPLPCSSCDAAHAPASPADFRSYFEGQLWTCECGHQQDLWDLLLPYMREDNAFAPGIGNRLDGWAARDLDVGSIIALAPDLSAFSTLLGANQDDVRKVLRGWGPGKFDAELVLDGKTMNPATGRSSATLIPPAFGLAGVNLHTWTGWGSVTHWNAFVANLEMHGQGTFYDPRLNDAVKFAKFQPATAENETSLEIIRNAVQQLEGIISKQTN